MTSNPTAPGLGERRAVRGLAAQYKVAAELIYDALLDEDLEWIRVADPEAGRVDDIQIARPGRLDAIQVKWSEYEERVTLNQLVSDEVGSATPTPSLIRQLADGWKGLTPLHPDRAVHVHLVTRSSPSTADRVGGLQTKGHPDHFQAFLRIAFAQRVEWIQASGYAIATDWAEPIERLRVASGLDPATFAIFICHCNLKLGFSLTDLADEGHRFVRRRMDDVQTLADYLLKAVADDRRLVQISRTDLLKALGWDRRFDLRFRHDFPVDDRLYRPVRVTVDALDQALRVLRSGYLALVGPPGSGKSTTLTQLLRYREGVRVVRYYAFVPQDTYQVRGEAGAFLHDICLSLRRLIRAADVGGRGVAMPTDREGLAAELGRLMAVLHEDWRRTGRVTVILVDGLDHIEREQNPARSLLNDLPTPHTIPEGVLFVLGTQPVGLEAPLMARIRSHVGAPSRMITMARLDRVAVWEIASTARPNHDWPEGALDQVHRLSDGHPLALRYLLARLATADNDEIIAALAETNPFRGDIEEEYQRYWEALREDSELRDLLGSACRLRGAVDLDVLLDLVPARPVLERFVRSTRHFFREETAWRWAFFHNSFRLFLLRVTTLDPFGRMDPAVAAEHHRRLAASATRALKTSPFSWELIHHLASAGDHAAVLDAFSQDVFRRQFFAIRSLDEISQDVGLCLEAAAKQDEPLAVIRGLLIEHELKEREQALDDIDLQSLVLELAPAEEMADAVIRGTELKVPVGIALSLVGRLASRGDAILARRLFDAAEPLDLLRGTRPLRTREQREYLESWVRVAWRFRPIGNLLDLLDQIRAADPATRNNPPEENLVIEEELIEFDEEDFDNQNDLSEASEEISISDNLMRELAVELLENGEHELVAIIEALLRQRGCSSVNVILATLDYRRTRLASKGKLSTDVGREALLRAMAAYPPNGGDTAAAVAFAEAAIRLGNMRAEAEACLAPVIGPLLVRDLERRSGEDDLQDLLPLLRQSRVLAALDKPLNPADAIGATVSDRHQGRIILQRIIILIGTLIGDADAGRISQPAEVVRRLRPAIHLFRRSSHETHEWLDWYQVEQRASGIFSLILEAAAAHGHSAFEHVVATFVDDWMLPRAGKVMGWRPAWKRSIIVAAYRMDGNIERTSEWLVRLDADIDIRYDLEERVTGYHELSRAWLTVGDTDRARVCFNRMIETSFAIYHRKDDQLQRWASWADRFVRRGVDASAALHPLLRSLPVVHAAYRGAEEDAFAAQLLETATAVSPGWGCELTDWLIREGACSWQAAITGLLRGLICVDAVEPQAVIVSLTIAAHLLVPVATDCDARLAQTLGRTAAAIGNSPEVQAALSRLLEAIAAKGFSFNRSPWFESLAEGCRIGGVDPADREIPETAPIQPDTAEDKQKLPGATLASGDFVSQEALILEARQSGRLEIVLRKISTVQQMDWTPVVEAALPHVGTLTALRDIHAQLLRLSPSFDAQARLAERAARLGDRREATRIIEGMIEQSKVHGWYRSWDGGTRQEAARCMVAVLGSEGRRRALDLFVRDYRTENLYPRDLLRDLDELVAILFETPHTVPLWREIEEHVLQLADIREVRESGIPPFSAGSEMIEPLVQFTLARLDHPIISIAEGALRAIIQLTTFGAARDKVISALALILRDSNDVQQSSALSILLCLDSTVITTKLALAVENLCYAPSAQVRLMALALMRRLSLPVPAPPLPTPLPAVYQLELPEAPMRERSLYGEARARGEALPDTTDAIELSRLYMPILEELVDLSGFSIEILTYRLKTFMNSISTRECWDRAAEEALQAKINALGLPMAYRRPRSAVAHRAFAHLAGELCGAGRVPWPYDPLTEWLLTVDRVTSPLDPVARPSWLVPPNAGEMGSFPRRNWVERAEDAMSSSARSIPDGGLVLGELTMDMRHDRGMPKETRATMIAHKEWPAWSDATPEHGFFFERTSFSASDYPKLSNLKSLPVAVVKGGGRFVPRFIALNPAIGRSLNWSFSSKGLFRWVDRDDRIMVESVRWQDGNRAYSDALGGAARSGDGWLVLATPAGAEHLSLGLKVCRRFLAASRSVYEEGEDDRRTQIAFANEEV